MGGIFGGLISKLMDTIPDEQKSGAESAVAGIATGAASLAVVAAVDKPMTADIGALAKEAVHPSIPPLAEVEGTSYSGAGAKVRSNATELG